MADSQILAKAHAEGFVVLAHDLDFTDLMAAGGAFSPSVIIFRLHNMRPESFFMQGPVGVLGEVVIGLGKIWG